MPDLEKAIRIFEGNYKNFVLRDRNNRDVITVTDVIALLKAQEPMRPRIIETALSKKYHDNIFKNYYCGNCGEFLHTVDRKDLFCSQCGRRVKWE